MIIGIGSILVDVLTNISDDSLLDTVSLERGSMVLTDAEGQARIEQAVKGSEYRYVAGGSAAKTIRGLARMGVEVGMIGKIGRDNVGEFVEKDFAEHGVHQHR